MADFKGYLLKAVSTGEIFSNNYIALDTWNSTPNQREEIKAYRDENTRDLTRITAAGRKSIFQFKTRKYLRLHEKEKIQKFFTDAESDADERRIQLEYWNDEENQYKTGDFYRPNIQFPIYKITENNIIYGELELKFVEY